MSVSNMCAVDVNGGRLKLECRKGMTAFAGLRMHKKFLPTGCGARGLCGQCRVRLLSGDAGPLTESEGKILGRDEISRGVRLGCQMRLTGDVSIEVPESVFSAREYGAVLSKVTPLTHDIRRFSFKLPEGESIGHRAGQFVNFVGMPHGEVKTQSIRAFSLATPSSAGDRIDLVVRRVPNGACTGYLFEHLKEGDRATIIGPFGDFYLRGGEAHCIWIAGGSGLSPFLGMLEDLILGGNVRREVSLFFGAVSKRDLYYVSEFRDIAEKHPWFKYYPALSGDGSDGDGFDHGLITDVVAKHVPDAGGRQAYLCGGPGMINACIATLTGRGMRRDDIFFDRFG